MAGAPRHYLDFERPIAELEGKVVAAEKDAARYRWLRDVRSPVAVMINYIDEGLSGDLMDTAVDAAMAGDKGAAAQGETK